MASTVDFAEFVCEQVRDCGAARYRKMFGDYMVYVDDRPVILICDNTAYVKMLPELDDLMGQAQQGVPYEGAKPHHIFDVENHELVEQVVATLLPLIPIPKPRTKRA
ncbi:MAG: TfoX/Sxy family protein [Propionibacteriaceae bacterium]|jgi:TfoX/Sxy family transcriptional regulator of competence genes|nr:TfoX/Sxy family protein [Propionibacteriaceae bacterium]